MHFYTEADRTILNFEGNLILSRNDIGLHIENIQNFTFSEIQMARALSFKYKLISSYYALRFIWIGKNLSKKGEGQNYTINSKQEMNFSSSDYC